MTEITLFESVSAIRRGVGKIARFSQNLEKTVNMEPIDERANNAWFDYQYTGTPTFECIFKDGFKTGVQSECEGLTRWHDPKEELPEDDRDVLVKTTLCRKYCIAFYKAGEARNYHWHESNGALDDDMVIGWRPIHEL
jgi:hypothetical protein